MKMFKMEYKAIAAALLLMLAVAPMASAQEGVGVVSLEFAVQQTDYFQQELLELQQEGDYKELEEEGEDIVGELRSLQERFQRDVDTMTQRQSQKLQEQISERAEKLREVQTKVEARQKTLWDRTLLELNPLMQEAVQEVIEARSIRLLVNRQAVLYADEIIDITEDVAKVVNRLHSRRASSRK